MDFSNLTKEQVEWIKSLVKESWKDGMASAYYEMIWDDEDFSYFEDSSICTRLEVLGD